MLDEPTNDLDMETLDLLQEVIADYDGTVLIVSHDRDFLDRTVTITLGLDGSGKVDIVAGGYEDWERKRRPHQHSPKGPRPAGPNRRWRGSGPSSPTRTSATTTFCRSGSTRWKPRSRATRTHCRTPTSMPEIRNGSGADRGDRQARAERDAAEHRWLELAEQIEALAG